MEDEPTTFGLSHEKLEKLWRIGDDTPVDRDGPTEEQKKAELLHDQLAESLPLDPTATCMLPETLSHVLEQFKPLGGCSIGDLLLDPEVDLSVIWQIKDRYKERAKSCSSEVEREVATAIYYAAIANALLFHEESLFRNDKITTFSYNELKESFSGLLNSSWLTPDLVGLFKRAQATCGERNEASSE
jgi:hypothetical protein